MFSKEYGLIENLLDQNSSNNYISDHKYGGIDEWDVGHPVLDDLRHFLKLFREIPPEDKRENI